MMYIHIKFHQIPLIGRTDGMTKGHGENYIPPPLAGDKMFSPSYFILKIQRQEGKQCNLDEVAHQDLRCLQIQLISSLTLKELRATILVHFMLFIILFKGKMSIL